MFVVAVRGDAPLTVMIFDQQHIVRIHPGAPSPLRRTVFQSRHCWLSKVSGSIWFRFRRPKTIHSVGQQDALKMNESRPALFGCIHSDQPEMRCGCLGLSRRNGAAHSRQNCGVSMDADLRICDLNIFEFKSSDLEVLQDFLLGQHRTVWTNEHVVIGIDRCKLIPSPALQGSVEKVYVRPEYLC